MTAGPVSHSTAHRHQGRMSQESPEVRTYLSQQLAELKNGIQPLRERVDGGRGGIQDPSLCPNLLTQPGLNSVLGKL